MSAQASFTNVSVQKFASEGDVALFGQNWTEHSPVLLKKLGDLGNFVLFGDQGMESGR